MAFRQALTFSFLGKYVVFALQFGSTMVISRLLTPSEIGIYAVAASFAGLGFLLRDFGVANYIVHEKELTQDRIRSATSVGYLTAAVVALAMYLSASPLGSFYSEPGVAQILTILSVNVLITPGGAIVLAYLRREMNFKARALIDVVGKVVSVSVTIAMAFLGSAYLSMAWGTLAGTVTTILLAQAYRPRMFPWLPGWRESRRVWEYSSFAGTSQVVQHIGDYAPDWIIGKSLGMYNAGIYSRADGTTQIFNRALMDASSPVLVSYFADLNRTGAESKTRYVYAVSSFTAFAWPFYAVLAVMAGPVIEVLYGTQWGDAVQVLPWLCAWRILHALTAFADPVLLGIGQPRSLLRVQLASNLVRIGLVFAGVQYGLEATVAMLALAHAPIRLAVYYACVSRYLGVRWLDYAESCGKSLLVAAATSVAPFVCFRLLALDWNAVAQVLSAMLMSGVVWSGVMLAVNHPLLAEARRDGPLGRLLRSTRKRISDAGHRRRR